MSAVFGHPAHCTAWHIPCAAGIEQTIKESPIGIQG